MSRLTRRKSAHVGLASQLTALPFLSRINRKSRQQKASRPRPTRLLLELLEDRVLLSASISGTVFNSLAGQTGLAGQVVYLNKTPSGVFNTPPISSGQNPTVSGNTLPGQLFKILPPGSAAAALQVQGVSAKITDVAVTIDATLGAGASGPVTVALVSPTGLTVPDLPNLFNILPGEQFQGTFDGNMGANFIQAEGAGLVQGTFRPQQYFTDPQAHIYDGNPNGAWGLVFIGDVSTLHLNSWSLTFTAPNVSAVTDAGGNYTFTGLQPGTYTVSAADSNATANFTLADGTAQTGVNFSVQPTPDLTGVVFNVVSTTATSATIQYTLTNQGNGDAQPFNVDVQLSASGVINPNGTPLTTLNIVALAAHASTSGTVTVNLPANTPADDYLGFVIRSPQGQTENNTANNSNQGAGIDLARIGANTNQQLTSDGKVQQQPSIAVDPNNANRIVVAYMDYSLIATGYAGIGIRLSNDGGQTWTTSSVALPPGFNQGAAQPIVHFDNNGHVFVSFAAATFLGTLPGLTSPSTTQRKFGFTSNNGIFVARGDFSNGVLSWNTPAVVASNSYSGTPVPFDIIPDFAVDSSNGKMYVTWARYYPAGQFPGVANSTAGSDIFIAVSTDGGATWTTQLQGATDPAPGRSVLLDPSFGTNGTGNAGLGFVTFPHITVGPLGDVYVSAFSGGFFSVFHSSDFGAHFTPPDYNNQTGLPFGASVTTLPNGNLFLDHFRTLAVRDIVADPAHPGRLYVAEANQVIDSAVGGAAINAGSIIFARSDDNGLTWQHLFTVGANATNFADLTPAQRETFLPSLNDDDGGNSLTAAAAAQLNNEVISGQALPSLAVDAQGNLTVIWYDARRDPVGNTGNPGQLLDVFGTVSTDGGNHFTSNFRVSDQTFDPNAGAFTDARNRTDSFLGDHIDVTAANGFAYAVWTDTRNGNQDIFFDKYRITPAPPPPTDRYSPNNTKALATNLGTVTAQQVYPRLALPPGGGDEWFTLTAGAAGQLSVFVSAASGFSNLHIEVTDLNGVVQTPFAVRPVSDANGAVIGQELDFKSSSNQVFFVHVSTPKTVQTATAYTLAVGALTADLGTQVQGTLANTTVQAGGQNIYRLAAGVGGTLQVTLTADGNNQVPLTLSILGSDGHTVLYTEPVVGVQPGLSETFTINVTQGQVVFLEVSNPPVADAKFTLGFVNLDQYESTGPNLSGALQDSVAQTQPQVLFKAGDDTPTKYTLVALTTGTLQATITGDAGYLGKLRFRIYAPDGTLLANDTHPTGGPGILAGQSETLSIQVTQGQIVILEVSGGRLLSPSGSYTLQFTNFTTSKTLFIPTVGDPTSIVAALLPGDKRPSLLTSNTNATDSLSVLKSNGDGTFQAPRQFDVGPGQAGSLTAGNRQVAVADLTGRGAQDVIVPNFRAADISVLLGDGAGGFQPQRTFDAVANPDSLVTGNFGNGHTDVAVLQNFPQFGGVSKLAILLGRGDGTFLPATLLPTIFGNGANSMITGRFTNSGNLDIVVFSKNQPQAEIFLGNGDGTFQAGRKFDIGENTFNATAVDLNGDGHLDLITTSTNSGNVYVQLGNGDGTFQAPTAFQALAPRGSDNVGVFGLAVANFPVPPGTPLPAADLQFGTQGIVVTAQARSGQGPAQVLLLPELLDANGKFVGFGAAVVLANVGTAGNIAVGDFGSGGVDLAVADKGGVTIVYGNALTLTPNTTAATARDLGSTDHVVTQTQAIVTGNEDAYYTFTVPKEVVTGSGDQVIDFSALLQYVGGAGLQLDVTDKNGLLGTAQFHSGQAGGGRRFRVVAVQGDVLQVHVFGLPGTVAGFGAYTLDVNVLPQVVSVQAESALPGGPATSLVLTFQGDRLDPTTSQDPSNYVITVGGATVVPESVILDPEANTAVAGNGLTYAAATRHTVTLSFAAPLPMGSYDISLKSNILAAPYSASESAVLVPDATFGGHVLVSAKTGVIHNGSDFIVPNLVTASGSPDLAAISGGTAFLTQLQNDLSAILERGLKDGLSDAAITAAINAEIFARFSAQFAGGTPTFSIGVLWLDPVSLGVQAPGGTATFDNSLAKNTPTNNISQSYVSVGGNVEVVVLAGLAGTFKLDVKNVPQEARGGAVVLDAIGNQVVGFTQALQTGTTSFTVTITNAVAIVTPPPPMPKPGGDGLPDPTPRGGIGGGPFNTIPPAVNALLFSALLAGFPDTNSGANFGNQSNGNGSPTNGTTQNANGLNASTGADGGGSGDLVADGRSSFIESAIDRIFLDFPDSVGGFVDLADSLVQDGADAAKTLAERINAFLKSQKPPAPMTMPPESLRTLPDVEWRQGDKETRRQGDSPSSSYEEVANASPMDHTGWRVNDYGLTLFMASGLGAVSLRDLADRDEKSRKKRR